MSTFTNKNVKKTAFYAVLGQGLTAPAVASNTGFMHRHQDLEGTSFLQVSSDSVLNYRNFKKVTACSGNQNLDALRRVSVLDKQGVTTGNREFLAQHSATISPAQMIPSPGPNALSEPVDDGSEHINGPPEEEAEQKAKHQAEEGAAQKKKPEEVDAKPSYALQLIQDKYSQRPGFDGKYWFH